MLLFLPSSALRLALQLVYTASGSRVTQDGGEQVATNAGGSPAPFHDRPPNFFGRSS